MRAADEFIIRALERFAHYTTNTVGITAENWKKLCGALSLLFLATNEIKHDLGNWVSVFLDGLSFLSVLLLVFAPDLEKPSSTSGLLHPERARHTTIRPVMLILSLVSIPAEWIARHSLWFQFLQLAWYFAICSDLPPAQSLLHKWWKGFVKGVNKLVPEQVAGIAPLARWHP